MGAAPASRLGEDHLRDPATSWIARRLRELDFDTPTPPRTSAQTIDKILHSRDDTIHSHTTYKHASRGAETATPRAQQATLTAHSLTTDSSETQRPHRRVLEGTSSSPSTLHSSSVFSPTSQLPKRNVSQNVDGTPLLSQNLWHDRGSEGAPQRGAWLGVDETPKSTKSAAALAPRKSPAAAFSPISISDLRTPSPGFSYNNLIARDATSARSSRYRSSRWLSTTTTTSLSPSLGGIQKGRMMHTDLMHLSQKPGYSSSDREDGRAGTTVLEDKGTPAACCCSREISNLRDEIVRLRSAIEQLQRQLSCAEL